MDKILREGYWGDYKLFTLRLYIKANPSGTLGARHFHFKIIEVITLNTLILLGLDYVALTIRRFLLLPILLIYFIY